MKEKYQSGMDDVVFALAIIMYDVHSFIYTVYCHQCVVYSVLIIIHLLQSC